MNNTYKIIIHCATSLLLITACSSPKYISDIFSKPDNSSSNKQATTSINVPSQLRTTSSESDLILTAERKASVQGRKILATGRKMIEDKLILPGGCWDYINEVYNRAGYPNQRSKRETIFKSTKNRGPYANINLIQSGDFVYYINHSYDDIEHSAIFVDWLDVNNKEALMLSYGGENRQEPARYLPYDLSHVYRIVRAKN